MRSLIAASVLLAAPFAILDAQQAGVDALDYRFELTLPERGRLVRAGATIRFARSEGVDTLRLDLRAPMRVTGAVLGCGGRAASGAAPGAAPGASSGAATGAAPGAATDRAAAPVAVRHVDDVVHIPLPPLAPSTRMVPANPVPVRAAAVDTLCATVRYEGEPADGLIISTDSAGRWQAFGDNWPDRGRHWLAAIDHPSDKARVEFVVDAPATRRVVANGTQRAQVDVPGTPARRRTTWATAAPIPTYLMVIAAAPLVEHDLGETACGLAAVARCVPQRVFTAPEQARWMPGRFAEADAIVRFFAGRVAPFPYEQLQHLQSSTRFGGMENAGAIFYNDALFRKPEGVGVGLIAHEVAHQWFGDAVTERAWPHLWLSEGFATYFAALYTEHARGDSAFRAELAGMRETITGAAVAAERPVIDTAQADLLKLLNANSYQKGGFVLHMLRREVGDSAFFQGIRAYYAARVHGTALTDELQAELERSAGRELGWFFDQWLRRPGFAEVDVRWRLEPDGRLTTEVEQGTRFAPYRFPLLLEVVAADGARTRLRLDVPAGRTFRHTTREVFAGPLQAVRVDPDVDLLAVVRTP